MTIETLDKNNKMKRRRFRIILGHKKFFDLVISQVMSVGGQTPANNIFFNC